MLNSFKFFVTISLILLLQTELHSQNDGLVGYWSFDDSTAVDNSGNGHDGYIYKSLPVEGIKGSAFEFDGNDYIQIYDSDLLDTDSSMTISLWIKPDSFASQGSKFISKWYSAPSEGDWLFSTSNKDSLGKYLAWYMNFANYGVYGPAEGYASIGNTDTSNFLKLHQWNHIAVTFDTGYVKVFYNGALIDQDTTHIKYTSLNEYAYDDIYIGHYRTLSSKYAFYGSIDEVRIYNRAIDELEMQNLYQELTSIKELKAQSQLPENIILHQNYPNPFNPTTVISYQLSAVSKVELSIYSILGQKVATLVSEKQSAGTYNVEWDATGFASGIYLYQLKTDKGFAQTKKLILLQ